MIASLAATAVALAAGLPIIVLGESLRDQADPRLKGENTYTPRKDI